MQMAHRFETLKYLDNLQARGGSQFTSEEFCKELSLEGSAAVFALHRLRKKREIASPVHGFNVLLPPEYRSRGCPPPCFFIDGMMSYLKIPYYVGLLSAAEHYGASHQKPQIFQVMVGKKRRDIKCGMVYIQFVLRKNLSDIPCVKREVKTGWIKISSPESTAFDLVGYQKQSAGLQNVLTVLSELSEILDSKKLVEVAQLSPISWAQRLGVLLSLVNGEAVANDLMLYVKKHAQLYVQLVVGGSGEAKTRDKGWKVFLNEELEVDEI